MPELTPITSYQTTPNSVNQNKRRKSYNKSSIVHKHSIKIEEDNNLIIKCNYCSITYSAKSTTNMKRHLKDEHQIGCINSDDSNNESETEDINEPTSKKLKSFVKRNNTCYSL